MAEDLMHAHVLTYARSRCKQGLLYHSSSAVIIFFQLERCIVDHLGKATRPRSHDYHCGSHEQLKQDSKVNIRNEFEARLEISFRALT